MSVPVAYVMMILVWSTTPLTIKMSTESVDAVFAALGRVAIGGVLGLVLVGLLRVRVPWGSAAWRTYLIGNINIFLGVYLTFLGAQYLPSGMVSVMFGLSPVLSALLARFFLSEKPLTVVQWIAALLGLIGLGLVFREQVQISMEHRWAVVYVLGSVLCFCFGSVLLKRWPPNMPVLAQTTGTLLVGIPLYLALSFYMGSPSLKALGNSISGADGAILAVSSRSLYAILYLGVFGSLIGIVAYFYALKNLSASTVALATFITPLLALALGRTFNNEMLSRGETLGTCCIIAALALYYWGGTLSWRIGAREGVKHGLL